jgi:hypothetical protein
METYGVVGALFKVCESYSEACLYLEEHIMKEKDDPNYESGAVAIRSVASMISELGYENLTQKQQEAAHVLPK